jgi:hypothetical protein
MPVQYHGIRAGECRGRSALQVQAALAGMQRTWVLAHRRQAGGEHGRPHGCRLPPQRLVKQPIARGHARAQRAGHRRKARRARLPGRLAARMRESHSRVAEPRHMLSAWARQYDQGPAQVSAQTLSIETPFCKKSIGDAQAVIDLYERSATNRSILCRQVMPKVYQYMRARISTTASIVPALSACRFTLPLPRPTSSLAPASLAHARQSQQVYPLLVSDTSYCLRADAIARFALSM